MADPVVRQQVVDQQLQAVPNSADGGCFFHTLGHLLGSLEHSTPGLTRQAEAELRRALTDHLASTLTEGVCQSMSELNRTSAETLRLHDRDTCARLYERARNLGIELPSLLRPKAAKPGSAARMLLSIIHHCNKLLTPKEWTPLLYWGLVASLTRRPVVVLSPDVEGGWQLHAAMGVACVFAPPQAEIDTASALYVAYLNAGKPQSPLDGSNQGNHFQALVPQSSDGPIAQLQSQQEQQQSQQQQQTQQQQLAHQQQQAQQQQQPPAQQRLPAVQQHIQLQCPLKGCSFQLHISTEQPTRAVNLHCKEHMSTLKDADTEAGKQSIKAYLAAVRDTISESPMSMPEAVRNKVIGIVGKLKPCNKLCGGVTSQGYTCSSCKRPRPTRSNAPASKPSGEVLSGTGNGGEPDRDHGVHVEDSTQPLLQWSHNDPHISSVLDSIDEAELLQLRLPTSARTPSTERARRCQQDLTQHVLQLLLTSLNEARQAHLKADVTGAGHMYTRATETSTARAFKLVWLLPLMMFGKQTPGEGMAPALRWQTLMNGTWPQLLHTLMRTVQQRPSPESQQQAKGAPRSAGVMSAPDIQWTDSDKATHHRCAAMAYLRGGVGHAARLLSQTETAAPCNEHTKAVLLSKHPRAHSRLAQGIQDTDPVALRELAARLLQKWGTTRPLLTITEQNVLDSLAKASAGKAAGLDGGRFEHYWSCLGPTAERRNSDAETFSRHTDQRWVQTLTGVYNTLLNECDLLPETSWKLWRSAALSGIGTAVRPIAVAMVMRRLLSSIAARRITQKLQQMLVTMKQCGVGMTSGVEHVAAETQLWHLQFGTVIKLDGVNAFNTIDRATILLALDDYAPELLAYFIAVYCGPHMPEMRAQLKRCDGAAADSIYLIISELGCQQGDPLGPLLFALGLLKALSTANSSKADGNSDILPHVAFLDDTNFFATPGFDEHTMQAVAEARRRMRQAGLDTNLTKSLVAAPTGHTFCDADRHRLQQLGMPYIDASTQADQRGFQTVGVPIGTTDYVRAFLQGKLSDTKLWTLGWQLIGMARYHMHAAFFIYSKSLTRRWGYLARNIDPTVATIWMQAYDSMCAWVFERMLHIEGSLSASSCLDTLAAGCLNGDIETVAGTNWLKLQSVGPPGLPGSARATATLRPREGGLGLPRLSGVNMAAFIAQHQATLARSVQATADNYAALHTDSSNTQAVTRHLQSHPYITAYRAALRHFTLSSDLAEKARDSHGNTHIAIQWALSEDATTTDTMTMQAVTTPLLLAAHTQQATDDTHEQSPTNPDSDCPESDHHATESTRSHSTQHLQRRLTKMLNDRHHHAYRSSLLTAGHEGRQVLAQLNSQCARSAMSWLGPSGSRLSTLATTALLLTAIHVEAWAASDATCPYGCAHQVSTLHALGCPAQHIYGQNTVHKGMKWQLQHLCTTIGRVVGPVTNEDTSPFTAPSTIKDNLLKADTLLRPGALMLAALQNYRHKGIILDTSVRCPTTQTALKGITINAAVTPGYAASLGERDKLHHHAGRYNEQNYIFVPAVQETFGRFGSMFSTFIRQIAVHAAQATGGITSAVRTKRIDVERQLRDKLVAKLMQLNVERVLGYMRGAQLKGVKYIPVSSLLDPTVDV